MKKEAEKFAIGYLDGNFDDIVDCWKEGFEDEPPQEDIDDFEGELEDFLGDLRSKYD